MSDDNNEPVPYRIGNWLPTDLAVLNKWLSELRSEALARGDDFDPAVAELQSLIEGNADLFMLFHQMFDEVPAKPPYNNDPTGQPEVRDYMTMLKMINVILTKAPEFNLTGLVGFPINAILDWPMGTSGGFAAFLDARVNSQLKAVLKQWGKYLTSPASCSVLSDDPHTGWFGADAKKAMPNFVEDFICDPALPHYGFSSWDDFFTRRFRDGVRPVADPDNLASIANACESAPYRIARNVQQHDTFWIKGQPYSVQHMLANDPAAEQFYGGTIYQAFLSALSYHRWHSPVSGQIVNAYVIPGTYYSEPPIEGFGSPGGPDPSAPNDSQGYITEVATRAAIFIKADNDAIGTICFLAVGMAEVSTCDITVQIGQRIQKGEQLGMFHFGGSTHCLMFGPRVRLDFDLHGQKPGLNSNNIPVRSKIAGVVF